MPSPTGKPRTARGRPFSFDCAGCRRCCRTKVIRLNPYEVARLAANRETSTTRFLKKYTDAEGTGLQRRPGGACIFLAAGGCAVYPDRPLACRLYPLARRAGKRGVETFPEIRPRPGCEGKRGKNGTVARFLAAQGAGPFLTAVDLCLSLTVRMIRELGRRVESDPGSLEKMVRRRVTRSSGGRKPDSKWLDVDATVTRHCAARGIALPANLGEKMALHIEAYERKRSGGTRHRERDETLSLFDAMTAVGTSIGVDVETLFGI